MQLFLCLNYRIEVKQRNFDDLMYDLQSLKEKNERLKDRVRYTLDEGVLPGCEGPGYDKA